ncbi:MAG: peptidylprolyl isomerase [Chloroflexi bacterium]|nr:peptidylprolyl isomerase [Chloroflexota bacterium]
MAKDKKLAVHGGMHRVERADRQQRFLIGGAIAVITLVVFLIVGGSLYESYLRPRQPVATVRGEVITIREFEARVRYERVQWVFRYSQATQTLQLIGNNPQFQEQIQQQLIQISSILDPIPFAERILNQMIDERLIRQEARSRGIFITEEEIDIAILERYSFYPSGTPTDAPTETVRATSTLSLTQYAIITATPTATITPTRTPIIEVTSAIFTPTATEDPDITPTIEVTTTLGISIPDIPTLTPTVITTQLAGELLLEELDVFADSGFDETELRKLHEFDLYRQRLFDQITADIDREQEQVWVRHILVSDEETALEVLDKLEDGADWTDLVDEYSENPTSVILGGDLGWFPNSTQEPDYSQDFMDVAFKAEIGVYNEPVLTPAGWHIIQVLGKEAKQLSLNEMNQLTQSTFLEFLESARENIATTIAEGWQARVPKQPDVPRGFGDPAGLLPPLP